MDVILLCLSIITIYLTGLCRSQSAVCLERLSSSMLTPCMASHRLKLRNCDSDCCYVTYLPDEEINCLCDNHVDELYCSTPDLAEPHELDNQKAGQNSKVKGEGDYPIVKIAGLVMMGAAGLAMLGMYSKKSKISKKKEKEKQASSTNL